MQRRSPFALVCSLALSVAVGACAGTPASTGADAPAAEADSPAVDPVARGRYLVDAFGCDDCHTPKVFDDHGGMAPDMSLRLSGHPDGPMEVAPPNGPWIMAGNAHGTAYSGPWGISYAANLTPHETTGMKIWTDEMFLAAIREGKHMGTSREILPPMPWPAFRNLTDEDLKAIMAFLRTLPPVDNEVPLPTPPPAME